MKKRIAAVVLSIFAFPAPAKAFDLNPYIGADFQGSYNSYDQYDDEAPHTLWGLNLHAGVTPHKHFGVELGLAYQYGAKDGIKVYSHAASIDALGYFMPMRGSKHFKLIGTAGIVGTAYRGHSDLINLEGAEFGIRGGGGAQFGMTENSNVRTLLRYQANQGDVLGSGWIYTLGVNHEF